MTRLPEHLDIVMPHVVPEAAEVQSTPEIGTPETSLPEASDTLAEALPAEEPAVTPEAAFAAHVAAVRTSGDAFDERTDFRKPQYIIAGAAAGFMPVAAISTSIAGTGAAIAVSGMMITGSAGMGIIAGRLRHAHTRILQKIGQDIQLQSGTQYELYRTTRKPDGTYAMALHWLGSQSDERQNDRTTAEELSRIAHLAEENAIDEMIVPSHILPADSAGKRQAGIQPYRMDSWLKKRKKLHFEGGVEQDTVLSASPGTWLAEADAIASQPSYSRLTASSERVGSLDTNHAGLQAIVELKEKPQPAVEPQLFIPGDTDNGPSLTTYEAPVREPHKPFPVYAVQKHQAGQAPLTIPDRTPTYNRTYRRSARILFGSVLATAAAAIGGHLFGDQQLEARDAEAKVAIARQHGVDPATAHIDDASARELADSWSTINPAWRRWRAIREAIGSFDFETGDTSDTGTVSGIGGGVGNIGTPGTATAWSLVPHNLSDDALKGHWTVDTANKLLFTKDSAGNAHLQWDLSKVPVSERQAKPHTDTDDATRLHLPSTFNPGSSPAIEVTARIRNKDIRRHDNFVNIPVQEGYRLAAASANGYAVYEHIHKGNTYTLEIPVLMEFGSDIRYWVVPDAARTVNAVQPTSYNISVDMNLLTAVYGKHMPADTPTWGAQGFVDYAHDRFTYDTDPWDEPLKADDTPEVSEIADQMLSDDEMNCTVATTAMVLADPLNRNPVFEYNNSDNPRQLAVGEAHARTAVEEADGTVRVYDPTPPEPLRAISKEIDRQPNRPVLPVVFAIAGLGLTAGAAYRDRRLLTRGSNRAARAAEEQLLGSTYREAAVAAEHVAWSAPGTVLTPRELAKRATAITTGEAKARLAAPEYHDSRMREALRGQPAISRRARAVILVAAAAADTPAANYDPFAIAPNPAATGLSVDTV